MIQARKHTMSVSGVRGRDKMSKSYGIVPKSLTYV